MRGTFQKTILLFALAIWLFSVLSACREDEEPFQVVVIDSQEELANLVADGSNRIDGDLFISGNITSLEVLGDVEKIIGNLAIIDSQLSSLDGLESLVLVTGDITITSTPPFEQNITDYCAIQDLLISGSFKSIIISNNAFNPTVADITSGNCSL